LFFDEMGELSSLSQAKILRTIETGEVRPLGASKSHKVDMRLIAATHRDLERMAEENRFRSDLYFRINVVRIHLDPLRDRPEDIAPLVAHFIQAFNDQYAEVQGRRIEGLTPAARDLIRGQEWPGNVRQLRNVIESAYLLAEGPWIGERDLLELQGNLAPAPAREFYVPSAPSEMLRVQSNPEQERDCLLGALHATRWNKSKAAGMLQWSRMTVYRKIAQYGLVQ
jgi:DNA-binding NtrC family response regulator